MKTYTKNYIGKGKKVANLDIITVSVKVEELLKNSFEYDGVMYAKFEIAGLKTPDNYGHTHTVYFSKAETVNEQPVKEEPKKKSKKGKNPNPSIKKVGPKAFLTMQDMGKIFRSDTKVCGFRTFFVRSIFVIIPSSLFRYGFASKSENIEKIKTIRRNLELKEYERKESSSSKLFFLLALQITLHYIYRSEISR
jgi:hypothetical protein